MNCNKYLVIICAIVTIYSGYGQKSKTVKATYSIQFIGDLKKEKDASKSSVLFLEKAIKLMEKKEYILKIVDNRSLFNEKEKLIVADNKLNKLFDKIAAKFTGFDAVTYTDLSNNTQIIKKIISDKAFIIKGKITNFNWQLSGKTKEIKGFLCRQAKGSYTNEDGRKISVIAWYAPKILLQFGPGKFNGLPGLILKVKHNQRLVYLKNITSNIDDQIVKAPTKGEVISLEKFNQKTKNALKKYNRIH